MRSSMMKATVWKRKWCILEESELFCYKEKSVKHPTVHHSRFISLIFFSRVFSLYVYVYVCHQNPSNRLEFNLAECIVTNYALVPVKKQHCFYLCVQDRQYTFAASSEEEMLDWVYAIKEQVLKISTFKVTSSENEKRELEREREGLTSLP